jgi:hypothetical protein
MNHQTGGVFKIKNKNTNISYCKVTGISVNNRAGLFTYISLERSIGKCNKQTA